MTIKTAATIRHERNIEILDDFVYRDMLIEDLSTKYDVSTGTIRSVLVRLVRRRYLDKVRYARDHELHQLSDELRLYSVFHVFQFGVLSNNKYRLKAFLSLCDKDIQWEKRLVEYQF